MKMKKQNLIKLTLALAALIGCSTLAGRVNATQNLTNNNNQQAHYQKQKYITQEELDQINQGKNQIYVSFQDFFCENDDTLKPLVIILSKAYFDKQFNSVNYDKDDCIFEFINSDKVKKYTGLGSFNPLIEVPYDGFEVCFPNSPDKEPETFGVYMSSELWPIYDSIDELQSNLNNEDFIKQNGKTINQNFANKNCSVAVYCKNKTTNKYDKIFNFDNVKIDNNDFNVMDLETYNKPNAEAFHKVKQPGKLINTNKNNNDSV